LPHFAKYGVASTEPSASYLAPAPGQLRFAAQTTFANSVDAAETAELSAYGAARSTITGSPLTPDELDNTDA
jgi:hypothetical protein